MAAPEIDSVDGINIGNVLVHAGNVDGRYVSADGTKLDGIDSGADVTGSNPPQAHGASLHTDRTRYIWVSPHQYTTGGPEMYGVALDPTVDEHIIYSFMMPNDFVSTGNVYVYYVADISGNAVVLDINTYYGAYTESTNQHTESDMGNVINIVDTDRRYFGTSALLSSVDDGDVVVIKVNRDANNAGDTNTGDIVINGILVTYTADM